MVELTTDRLSSADTKTKLVDCAVQVAVKTANKSVNAHQDFANSRYDKQTQATDDNNRLSDEEEAKFERDGKELGWFEPKTTANAHAHGNPNKEATYWTKKIILAKMDTVNYARSNSMGAKLLAETHAARAVGLEQYLIHQYRRDCSHYYSKDSHSRFYRTEQDEVIEVTTDEVLEDRISSYINYTEEFMRVHNAKRALTFQ